MKKFEFKVSHSFKIREGKFFALVGIMEPESMPIIAGDYYAKLITKSGKEHVFTMLGEEIFVASPGKIITKRALGTTDNIEEYLQDLENDPVWIVGYEIENRKNIWL